MSPPQHSKRHRVISTPLAPGSVGPYSQAILVGDTLYCSGQIPLDPDTEQIVERDITDQTERVMKNLGAILRAAGMSYTNVVRCTIFLKNMTDYAHMNEVYSQYFTNLPPSRETVAVAGLPRDALIEISCIAIR